MNRTNTNVVVCAMLLASCGNDLISDQVLAQSSNHFAEIQGSLETLRSMIAWGRPTNGYTMGILPRVIKPEKRQTESSPALVDWQLQPALLGLSSNKLLVALPPRNSLAEIKVFDPEGKPVPMTSAGKRIGRPISLAGQSPFHEKGFQRVVVDSEFPDLPGDTSLRILELFKIKAPGEYSVNVKLRAVTMITNQWVISMFEVGPLKLRITAD